MQAVFEDACRAMSPRKAPWRLSMAILLALTVLLSAGLPARADGGIWCITDPVVNVAGVPVNILVAVPAEYQTRVTGPIAVQVATGPHVPRSLVSTDAGFNGFGEQVQFVTLSRLDASMIVVSVQVPVSGGAAKTRTIPVRLTLRTATGGEVTAFGASGRTVSSLQLMAAGGPATGS